MQSETLRLSKGVEPWFWSVRYPLPTSQLLFQIGIEDPSPIFHLLPALRMNLALQILLQTKLGLCTKGASKKLLCRKYLALYILAISVWGLVIILHPCLPSIARLKVPKLLNPMPPSFLCIDNLSHDIQWIPLLWAPEWPHQNEFIIFSISSQRDDGKVNKLIKYVGIDWRTYLIKTSRPALERHLLLHELIFFHTLSLIKLKVVFLLLHIIDGRPRYLPVPNTAWTPRILAILLWKEHHCLTLNT